ncbi:MAG TPA: toast rack family protein [Bryobacteraceae bacterium]|nr:toast rack family protein [Bryobacteraceae bacterium]
MARLLILFAALALTACEAIVPAGATRHETRTVALDNSEMARLELKMGAGELQVEGGSTNLLDADLTYNVPSWKPILIDDTTGVRREIRLEQPSGSHAASGTVYKWNLRLNNDVLLDVVAHLGAGSARMTLGSVNLRSIEVHMGVGEMNLDLSGNPRRDYTVDLKGGVGQATVILPASAGIVATAHGGIGQISVKGLEKRGDRWINPAHEQAPVTIHVNVEGGVGQINIVAQ